MVVDALLVFTLHTAAEVTVDAVRAVALLPVNAVRWRHGLEDVDRQVSTHVTIG